MCNIPCYMLSLKTFPNPEIKNVNKAKRFLRFYFQLNLLRIQLSGTFAEFRFIIWTRGAVTACANLVNYLAHHPTINTNTTRLYTF